jgi:hypothetical protein
MMTKKRTVLFILLTALLFIASSCSKEGALVSRSLSLQEAEKRFSANPEVTQFIGLAGKVLRFAKDQYGIVFNEKQLRFLLGSSASLTWRLIALPKQSLKPAINSLYFDTERLETQKAKALQAGQAVYVQGENPLQVANKTAPLLETWARWNYDRQVERLFQLVFHQYTQQLKRSDAEALSRFLAEKATEEFLLATLGGASPVLARYISEQRDEKTFATLFPDFAERVYNLYTHRDPAATEESLENSRTQLLKVWIAEYKKRYTERFLTNRYAEFGTTIPGDPEILAWEYQLEPLRTWKQYQGEYRRAGETVAAYLKVLSK